MKSELENIMLTLITSLETEAKDNNQELIQKLNDAYLKNKELYEIEVQMAYIKERNL